MAHLNSDFRNGQGEDLHALSTFLNARLSREQGLEAGVQPLLLLVSFFPPSPKKSDLEMGVFFSPFILPIFFFLDWR